MATYQPNYPDAPGEEPRVGAQVSLQPLAAPSILGLFAFAGATFMVAANLAGWYGDLRTPRYLFPFAAMFGGLAQFLAGMWAVKARDGLASAMHGTWAPSGWRTASSTSSSRPACCPNRAARSRRSPSGS